MGSHHPVPTKIYILSGLGVDQRVFSKIDFNGLPIAYIDWITPFPHESISCYAKRLCSKITAKLPILIGLSFGGMVAIEIAKIIQVEKIVLLASAKTNAELPVYYKILGHLKINALIPHSLLTYHTVLMDYFFGIATKEDSMMLRQILKDTDPIFLKWAINEIIHWKNKFIPDHVIHIHGTKDHIIPIKNLSPTYSIQDAGHFMTMTHAHEIELLLNNIL